MTIQTLCTYISAFALKVYLWIKFNLHWIEKHSFTVYFYIIHKSMLTDSVKESDASQKPAIYNYTETIRVTGFKFYTQLLRGLEALPWKNNLNWVNIQKLLPKITRGKNIWKEGNPSQGEVLHEGDFSECKVLHVGDSLQCEKCMRVMQ